MKIIKTVDTFILFIFLVLLTILLSEAAIYFLDVNQLMYKNLSEQLTLKQIKEVMDLKARWAWVGYFILPLLLFLKITIIALILAMGGFFTNTILSHKVYFQIVLRAEFIFLLIILFKLIWFKFISPEFTVEQLQQFMPLSIGNFIDVTAIPTWALYPIQLINLFEVVYWICLAYLIDKASKTTKGMKVVLTSYAPSMLIWMIFVMFLTLNMTT